MADDSGYVNKQLNSIDYAHVLCTPIEGAGRAQKMMAYDFAEFIKAVGFDENGKMITSPFKHTLILPDGKKQVEIMEVPFIATIPVPNIQVTRGKVELDIEVNQSAQSVEKIDGGGEGKLKLGWGPFGFSVKARASYSRENTRKTDTRAKHHVEIEFEQGALPEGLSLLIERMRNGAFENLPALTDETTA